MAWWAWFGLGIVVGAAGYLVLGNALAWQQHRRRAVAASPAVEASYIATRTHGRTVNFVPLLPALRRLLVAWKLRTSHSKPHELVIGTADGKPVAERNLRRALEAAKESAGLDALDERLSIHALRHSFAS